MLLDKGAAVNATAHHGWTPLHLASKGGHSTIVKILLDKRDIRVNVTTKYYETPLSLAVEKGSDAIVAMLLDAGAKITIQEQYPIIHKAARRS
jgi:ankyrin repeat protein